MDSRPILKNTKKLGIFIDSKTFDELLKQNDRLAIAILRHYDSKILDFIRNPLATEFEALNNIVSYELEKKDSEFSSIKIVKKEYKSPFLFSYKMEDIIEIAKKVCGKDSISQEELNKIITIFIQAVFNESKKSNIYITNDKLLLKNRLRFESHFPGYLLNIMSVEEASLFIDLFFKKNEKYFASSGDMLNKGYWYRLSRRLKFAHYNMEDPILNALANRFCYVLMALDEMGIQYFLGTNNDTMDNTLYHFNYFITLITGIFDNLALKTDSHLGINFALKIRISLNNKSGENFLKEVRNKRQDIRDHINAYVEFISLIYLFRELIVHREGLSKTGFENKSDDGEWRANFIKVNEIDKIKQKLKMCGDKASNYDPFTKWGFYEIHTEYFLDPYNFSLQATKKLIEFIEKYLELLECNSFIKIQKQTDDDFIIFKQYHLGF